MTEQKMRSHTCGELTLAQVEKQVSLAGWVHRRRDHGGLIFIDLRDRFGITQVVFRPEVSPKIHEEANRLRSEWVIRVEGRVAPRAEGMANLKLKTGEIEIEAHALAILSPAETPPFSLCDDVISAHEELRLKYRYLDIRRGEIAQRLIKRHRVCLSTRNYLDQHGFTEIMTPVLGKSTPEGARDYLVPSRIYPGTFYALPQSPQLFKQLLMIAGMDRYFQIAVCFRDEDLRADRQPEFTQIDLELSFSSCTELFTLIEGLMARVFKECNGIDLKTPFPRLPYAEVMEKYGTDKPDLRFGMPLVRLNPIAERCEFSVFRESSKKGEAVKGFCIKGGADISRKQIEEYNDFVHKFGAPGLAWMKMTPDGLASGVAKFFGQELLKETASAMQAETGDLLVFVAAPDKIANQSLDHLRRQVARERGLIDPQSHAWAWITDFPLFQWDEETQGFACEHHPFTSPYPDDIGLLDADPLKVRSSSYDLVLNGYELASGSQRIYDGRLQEKIFNLLKLSQEDIKNRFGFFIEALRYGTPPHMGIALGLDRLMMILTRTESIRDVIAFPKTQKATDLMMEAPSAVLKKQLTELKIHVEVP